MIDTSVLPGETDGFVHQGLFYDSDDEYRTAVGDFVRTGLDAGEPVLVAVPGGKIEMLREALGGQADEVSFIDMAELGRNPARITPTVRGFVDAHAEQRVRFVGEPIWPSRTAAEVREATRHEALINAAFADTRVTILCPYDTAGLGDHVLADAEHTHPAMLEGGEQRASTTYSGPTVLPPGCDEPLSAPPEDAVTLAFTESGDLAHIRSVITDHASDAGLSADRVGELVLAVGEVTANTLRHTRGGGSLHLWRSGDRLVCQVQDGGRIADPLADRRRPTHGPGGRGLWLVNQLCELVQLRSHETGTTIRLHTQLS